MQLAVFARKEATTDSVSLQHGLAHKKDVVFYKDAACTQLFARKPWHQSGQPRRTSRFVTLNCYNWALNWVH